MHSYCLLYSYHYLGYGAREYLLHTSGAALRVLQEAQESPSL